MPEPTTPAAVTHGCVPQCEPWITASHCGVFTMHAETGEVSSVKCPSMYCSQQMVPITNGRMADHDSPADIASGGQKCPWIGMRVISDRTQYPELASKGVPAPDQPPQAPR